MKQRGETVNITHICEFGWYNWVYHRENAVTYPGRQLAPRALAWAKHGHQTCTVCQDSKIQWLVRTQVIVS